ncbi:myeloid-associated differentiation marker-like [Phacochoerus africanus]|uniref:myeloid-associated differentiation marker-like n=1 Tax=Phacochoerus africanus TaxID=41426 RepID=UPI001FDAC061|nr:myeloid-associated differentiation marker-like [Phacochoerus africanus]
MAGYHSWNQTRLWDGVGPWGEGRGVCLKTVSRFTRRHTWGRTGGGSGFPWAQVTAHDMVSCHGWDARLTPPYWTPSPRARSSSPPHTVICRVCHRPRTAVTHRASLPSTETGPRVLRTWDGHPGQVLCEWIREAFCVTFSCYAAVSCLSVSITYPSTIQLSAHGPCQAQVISTTVLSFTASVVYATEVACTGTGTGTWVHGVSALSLSRPPQGQKYLLTQKGLDSVTIIGYFLHLLQLLSTCVAFSLVVSASAWIEDLNNSSVFIWCFCFTVTLITLIVELLELDSAFYSWDSFLIIYASYFTLFCLSTSIAYSIIYLQFIPDGSPRNYAIATTAFSCIASVAYAIEVVWTCVHTEAASCSFPGLLKRLENFVACVIFTFISNPSLYQHHLALRWCVAVYSICSILVSVAILGHKCECDIRPLFTCFVWQTLPSTLLYFTAVVLWPLCQFNEEFGGQPQWSSNATCSSGIFMCVWDQRLAVAILTAINLLIYVVDLVYSIDLFCVS